MAAASSASVVPQGVIREGQTVILRFGQTLKAITASKTETGRFGKLRFSMEQTLGRPYGQLFEIDRNRLVPLRHPTDTNWHTEEGPGEADNRSLNEDQTSQTLQYTEIVELQEKGVTGQELIDKLAAASTTFETKTEFSKAKWMKKKKAKHLKLMTVERPTLRLVAQVMFDRGPMKICFLRHDSLAMMLSRADVRPFSKVLVLDTVGGLLAAAVIERLGGHGTVVQLHPGNSPPKQAVDMLNFDEKTLSVLHPYALKDLAPTLGLRDPEPEIDTKAPLVPAPEQGEATSEMTVRWAQRQANREKRRQRRAAVAEMIQRRDFDCLVVATKYNPVGVVPHLINLLAPSSTFSIFNGAIEPLAQLFFDLRTSGNVINQHLGETWMRVHQVLPKRTHPTMNMHGASGYVLSGTTITNEAGPPSAAPAAATAQTGSDAAVTAATAMTADGDDQNGDRGEQRTTKRARIDEQGKGEDK
eukprot:m.488823 g.488823  ORF g.488823 m.488823 type:complete len:472 (-) comp26105_c0_seq1:64-1479(-)